MLWPRVQVKGAVSYIERRRAAVSMANDVAFKAGLQARFECSLESRLIRKQTAGTLPRSRSDSIVIATLCHSTHR